MPEEIESQENGCIVYMLPGLHAGKATQLVGSVQNENAEHLVQEARKKKPLLKLLKYKIFLSSSVSFSTSDGVLYLPLNVTLPLAPEYSWASADPHRY